jgi:GDP-mannose transporter
MASSDDDNKKRDYTVELGDRQPNGSFDAAPVPQAMASPTGPSITNSPPISILAYCGSSILMTVTNKYVLSSNFNLNFFLLAVQVCNMKEKRQAQDEDSWANTT